MGRRVEGGCRILSVPWPSDTRFNSEHEPLYTPASAPSPLLPQQLPVDSITVFCHPRSPRGEPPTTSKTDFLEPLRDDGLLRLSASQVEKNVDWIHFNLCLRCEGQHNSGYPCKAEPQLGGGDNCCIWRWVLLFSFHPVEHMQRGISHGTIIKKDVSWVH